MNKMPGVTAIGVIGNGMIGDSMTVLTTGHGYKTVSVVRDMARVPAYKAKYDEYYKQMIDHGLLTEKQGHGSGPQPHEKSRTHRHRAGGQSH